MQRAVAFSMLLAGAVLPPVVGAAQDASVLESVEECDILAAHPADPQRMAEGVADDQIVPRLAIEACKGAIESDPDDPRFTFQLGRALLAAHDEKAAIEAFQRAADAGYAAGWAYLGDAYQFGLGVAADGNKALAAYKRAVGAGFKEAEEQIKQLQFDPSMYAQPFVALLFEGKYPEISALSNDSNSGAINRNYLFTFIQTLSQDCEPFLSPVNVPALYGYRYPAGWKIEDEDDVVVAIQSSVAEYDAATFVRRHTCDGLVAGHVFTSINRYLETRT